ncbi:MAG: DUF4465 domain-containing protein [Prevotella sp.]|nr:DUF4465 domain-containing protein [Prevotella sp.]
MKTNKFFGLAAIVCGAVLSMTSCTGNQDNPIVPEPFNPEPEPVVPELVSAVIGFESATLNEDGYWCGDENGEKFDNWGSEAFACSYKEDIVNFPVNWTPAWASWMGYAVSNRTETTYAAETMTPDQFNNTTGTAKSGSNFCVVQTYGETIDFDAAEGAVVKGFWYTNNAWTVDAILNGDGMTPGKFETEDWLKCTVTGTKADGTTATVDITLAENGDYVKDWQYADLSALGKVVSLSFAFSGSKNNDYGLTTPAYMCIDDLEIEYLK